MLTALRDWAAREKYRALRMIVDAESAALFGPDAEADPFSRTTLALTVGRRECNFVASPLRRTA